MWTHTSSSSIFLTSRNNTLAISFVARVSSEDYQMEIIQYIICCIIISILPPMTWIYMLIYWVWNDCKIQKFSLADVVISEFWNDDTSMEEIAILQQMLENFKNGQTN